MRLETTKHVGDLAVFLAKRIEPRVSRDNLAHVLFVFWELCKQ